MRYDYCCTDCGFIFEISGRPTNYSSVVACANCGAPSERYFEPESAPYTIPDIKPYHDKGLGMDITSRAMKRDVLRVRGLRELGNDGLEKAKDTLGEIYEKEKKKFVVKE